MRLAFEPKTSFPGVGALELCELELEATAVPPPDMLAFLSWGADDDTGGDPVCKGFPSKRLPTPVNGLNFGSASSAGS